MEEVPDRFTINSNLGTDNIFGTKSRLKQMRYQSLDKAEVICPEPRRFMRAPFILDGFSRSLAVPDGRFRVNQEDYSSEIMGAMLGKDASEDVLEPTQQIAFFCSSPPVRTDNPLVHDPQFVKQSVSVASPLGTSPLQRSMARTEWGSPSCGVSFGAKPNIRIEGFTCGNSERHHDILRAVA